LICETGVLHDSFLNSHSEDSERDKNMQRFLQDTISSERKEENKPSGSSLSDMIELSKKINSLEETLKVYVIMPSLYI